MRSTANFTLVVDHQPHDLRVDTDEQGGVWIDADEVRRVLGWVLTGRGLCQGSLCVPRSLLGASLEGDALELTGLARIIRRPLTLDPASRTATLGPSPVEGRSKAVAPPAQTTASPRLADSEATIASCFEVMRELRAHLVREDFVARVRRQAATGYRLALLDDGEGVACVAGFRVGENLAWGRFLYVDDLVTASRARSAGHGSTMLRWLMDLARAEGCDEFHLDSGIEKVDAHRFYRREGLEHRSLHFRAVP